MFDPVNYTFFKNFCKSSGVKNKFRFRLSVKSCLSTAGDGVQYYRLDPPGCGSAILPLRIFPYLDELTMLTVPVAMVTVRVAMELAFCTKLPSSDQVTCGRPW